MGQTRKGLISRVASLGCHGDKALHTWRSEPLSRPVHVQQPLAYLSLVYVSVEFSARGYSNWHYAMAHSVQVLSM